MPSLFDLPLNFFSHKGVSLAYRQSALGKPPLLLLHGYPQTHVLWHKVWGELSEHFCCVAMDLRGYGDSDKPQGLPDHSNYSKRSMAGDAVALMQHLGFDEFAILAHDRGARVAHRLMLDHPDAVSKASLLDIAPTLDMYRSTDEAFARAYYHWFFLIQPSPLPETLIGHDPAYYCRTTLAGRFNASGDKGAGPFTPRALEAYETAANSQGWAHAICEDYRASASIDLEHDQTSRQLGEKINNPLQIIWGKLGVVQRCFNPLALWQAQTHGKVEGHAIDNCGHYIPEETPEALLEQCLPFLIGMRR